MSRIVEYLRKGIDVTEIIATSDVRRMKKILLVKRGVLTSEEKRDLIDAINDPIFTKNCIKDITLGLDEWDKAWLVGTTGDVTYVQKQQRRFTRKGLARYGRYALKKCITLELEDRSFEEIVETLERNELGLDSDVIKSVLLGIGITQYGVIQVLQNSKIKLEPHDIGVLLDKTRKKDDEPSDILVEVDSVSATSVDFLQNLSDEQIVKIRSLKSTDDDKFDYYSKDEFIKIKKAVDKILEGVERPIPGDETSELKTFKTIFSRLSSVMRYDTAAIKNKNEENERWQRECRNLLGGLVKGKTVCAGYAVILVRLLQEMGMEAQYIRGYNKKESEGHAWTQVKIGRKVVQY